MFAPDEMAEKAADIRDQVLALIREHENEEHAGFPCWGNRVSLLAWLAHNLGCSGPRLEQFAESFRRECHEYDARCTDMACRGQIARKYGKSHQNVSKIVRRHLWKHVLPGGPNPFSDLAKDDPS